MANAGLLLKKPRRLGPALGLGLTAMLFSLASIVGPAGAVAAQDDSAPPEPGPAPAEGTDGPVSIQVPAADDDQPAPAPAPTPTEGSGSDVADAWYEGPAVLFVGAGIVVAVICLALVVGIQLGSRRARSPADGFKPPMPVAEALGPGAPIPESHGLPAPGPPPASPPAARDSDPTPPPPSASRGSLLDVALGALRAGSERDGLPSLNRVEVTPDAVEVVLDAPGEAPARFTPLGPRRWRIEREPQRLVGLGGCAISPVAALAPVGASGPNSHVLLDLEASGIVVVDGPGEDVADLLRAMVLSVARAPWPERPSLLLAGVGGSLGELSWITQVDSLSEALARAEAHARRIQAALELADASTIGEARANGARGEAWTPLVVVSVLRASSDSDRHRLRNLGLMANTGVAIVTPPPVDGILPGRRLSLRDGRLLIDGLDESIRPRLVHEREADGMVTIDVEATLGSLRVDEPRRLARGPVLANAPSTPPAPLHRTGGAPPSPAPAPGIGPSPSSPPRPVTPAAGVPPTEGSPSGWGPVASPFAPPSTFTPPQRPVDAPVQPVQGRPLLPDGFAPSEPFADELQPEPEPEPEPVVPEPAPVAEPDPGLVAGVQHIDLTDDPATAVTPAAGSALDDAAPLGLPPRDGFATQPMAPPPPPDVPDLDDGPAERPAAATVEPSAGPAPPEPVPAGPETVPEASSAPVPTPAGPADNVQPLLSRVEVLVRVLGHVEAVRIEPDRVEERLEPERPKVLEAITYLALRDGGVDREALEIRMFPDGSNVPKTMYNTISAARRLLGDELFPSPVGGRYRLEGAVSTDYALFCELIRQADATDDAARAVTLLSDALGLVSGEPFMGAARHYSWAGPHRNMIVADVVDAAEELAEIHLALGQWREAEWAARQGLLAFPQDERLYRLLMRAAAAAGNTAAVRRVYSELCGLLSEPGSEADPGSVLHPDTLSLLQELTGTSQA